jgi:glycosyltransferase involved in cell wall biosynthesis
MIGCFAAWSAQDRCRKANSLPGSPAECTGGSALAWQRTQVAGVFDLKRTMRLDVVIPTYNRAWLLPRTLESLLAAARPAGLSLTIVVVDNRSTDDTRAVVDRYVPKFAGGLRYVYEPKAGRSSALNAGIAASNGELVGMIDDDEEVDHRWLHTIVDAFADPTVDFIGGPYVPRWGAEKPAWLTTSYRAAVGWVDSGDRVQQFGPGFDAMLMGGNAVIRRDVLERVGPYATDLGRASETQLLSCEDRDMFNRLLGIGARGFYRPDLVIFHFIPPERLTKKYFRRWSFWHGVSLGVLDRRQPAPVPYLCGVPRYMIGSALRGALDSMRAILTRREPARIFATELEFWELTGFFYGKHFYRGAATRENPEQATTTAPELHGAR